MSFPEFQCCFKAEVDCLFEGRAGVLEVDAGLRYILGNRRPHFYVTGIVYEAGKPRTDGYFLIGGAIHDVVLRSMPELEPVVRLHLSDDLGEPMHAVENALYWAGMTRFKDARSTRMLARHLRISQREAAAFRLLCVSWGRSMAPRLVDEMRPRWRREAQEAIEILEKLRRGHG